jgi:hypothetical protein
MVFFTPKKLSRNNWLFPQIHHFFSAFRAYQQKSQHLVVNGSLTQIALHPSSHKKRSISSQMLK